MCNHQFLFHAGMKEKNVCIMSRKYVHNMITVLRRWWHENFPLIMYFLVRIGETRKKMALKKKWVYCFFFFIIPWKFFWKIGQLPRILWNCVLIMLFRGKEFRKCLAATEINKDFFQQDHWDTDDDDVPPLSPSVVPQNVTCPPPSSKKTKINKEKWTTDMVEEHIWCLAEQKSLYEFKGLDFEAD